MPSLPAVAEVLFAIFPEQRIEKSECEEGRNREQRS